MSEFHDPAMSGQEPARHIPSVDRLPPARHRVRTRVSANPDSPQPAPAAEAVTALPPEPASSGEGRDYDIGYGKPPKTTQFKRGQSGNPKGKKKGARTLNTIAREVLTEQVKVRRPDGKVRSLPRIEVVLQKIIEAALKGSPKALEQLLKLYASAVPDVSSVTQPEANAEFSDISPTDLAILEQFLRCERSDGEVAS